MVDNRPRQTRKTPVAYDDPPLSTDTEGESASEGTLQADKLSDRAASPKRRSSRRAKSPVATSSPESSADERHQKAKITSTKFAPTRKSTRETPASTAKRRRLSASPERPSAKTTLKPGNHLQNKFGFTSKKQSKATYSKRGASSQSSQPDSSQGSSKLRVPSSIESPQKKKKSKFILPGKNIPSSPAGSPRKLLTQLGADSESSEEDSILASLKPQKKKGSKAKGKSTTPEAPRAVFKLPVNFLDSSRDAEPYTGTGAGLEDLSKLSSDEDSVVDKSALKIPEEFEEPPAAKCPWCNKEVDKTLLDKFSKGKRLNVNMQTRFCELHKQHAAKQTWTERGYPEIDWETIENRFAEHRDFLLAIVDGKGSHFRNIHAKNVEEGKSRSMKEDENLNPGYYGPRGFNAMCDYLVEEFSDELKKRAVDDRVIAGRGSAAFIQAVLVAELGVRLIMDDMGLSETKARQLMSKSKDIGELVQPELDR